MLLLRFIVLSVLRALSPVAEASGVTHRLSCVNHLDMESTATGSPIIMLGSTHEPRLEDLHVYSDGQVTFSVQIRFREVIDCRARLDPRRVALLKAELLKTRVWLAAAEKRIPADKNESLFLDLGPSRRCRLQMSSVRWSKIQSTQAVQRIIDRLKNDVCEGMCPEPRAGDYPVLR